MKKPILLKYRADLQKEIDEALEKMDAEVMALSHEITKARFEAPGIPTAEGLRNFAELLEKAEEPVREAEGNAIRAMREDYTKQQDEERAAKIAEARANLDAVRSAPLILADAVIETVPEEIEPDFCADPEHYTYSDIEPIDVIEAWDLNFRLGCVLKYVARCNHKGSKVQDLKKAIWYLEREIKNEH